MRSNSNPNFNTIQYFRFFLLLRLFALFTLSLAQPAFSESLKWEQFREIALQSHSREEFMQKLKLRYATVFSKENHVLVRKSESPCNIDVDSSHPRIIQFDTDSKFSFAYSSGHSGFCAKSIEALAFNSGTQSYDSYRVLFLSNSKTPLIQHNPIMCIRCHNQPLEAIFRSGEEVWPGLYGEENGVMNVRRKAELTGDAENFSGFLKVSSKNAPYSLLEGYSQLKPDLSNLPVGKPINRGGIPYEYSTTLVPNFEALTKIDLAIPVFRMDSLTLAANPISKTDPVPFRVSANVPRTCVHCHTERPIKASYIPFDEPKLMKEYLTNNNEAFYRSILDVITNPVSELRMPPQAYPPLKEDQISRLKAQLRAWMQ